MSKEAYEVCGTSRVFEHEPGEVFEQDIPEPQRTYLIEGGAIKPTSEAVSIKEPEVTPTPEESAQKVEQDSAEEAAKEAAQKQAASIKKPAGTSGEEKTGGAGSGNPIRSRRS